MLRDLLGSYAYKASAKLLCGKDDQHSFANFAGKRFIYFEEPEFKKKIQTYLIKELTGGDEFCARGIYSSNTSNKICATFILNTNNIPQFTQADNALANRLLTVTWDSKFTKNKDEVNDKKHIYLADTTIGNEEWKKKYLPHLFNYLLKYHTKWLEMGEQIPESSIIQQDNEDILNFSDNFKNWLNGVVKKTENVRDKIRLKDLSDKLLTSQYWTNLPKNAKSIGAQSFLKRELRDREETRLCIKKQATINRKIEYGLFLAEHVWIEDYIPVNEDNQDKEENNDNESDEDNQDKEENNGNESDEDNQDKEDNEGNGSDEDKENKMIGKKRLRSRSIEMIDMIDSDSDNGDDDMAPSKKRRRFKLMIKKKEE